MKITERNMEALRAIVEYFDRVGYPPTVGDVAKEMGCSRQSAFTHMCRLEAKQLITREPGVVRGLTITDEGRELAAG